MLRPQQDQIRTFKDGKLKTDCFSEARLLGFPPGCGAYHVNVIKRSLKNVQVFS